MQAQLSRPCTPRVAGRLAGWSLTLQRACVMDFGTLARRLGRDRRQPAHLDLGERGELEALFFLRRQGYIVMARRWRAPELSGDLDLVAWEGDTLCFIEVKTRLPARPDPGSARHRPGKTSHVEPNGAGIPAHPAPAVAAGGCRTRADPLRLRVGVPARQRD